MGDDIELRLIFVNDNTMDNITANLNTLVLDVKRTILEEHWPSSMPAPDQIERLRLICNGRELGGKGVEDMTSLSQAKLSAGQEPTPVHVAFVLQRTEETKTEEAAKTRFCTLQ
mmetsp:Transcript_1583/g.3591  ORF Transcript_1583/g.3591 Transcript_1583/m.3591 type:complete len:114 (-) Transcript_1583:223-564(-)